MRDNIGLPKIAVERGAKGYELTWDYQSNEANNILFEKREYLSGYIDGAIAAIANKGAQIICASCLTGTVRNLTNEAAAKLEETITNLLHPLVKREHEKIEKHNNLPHVKLQHERGET
jgi:hypothetical protein